jgi:ketosteroid isomerase-like protein
MIQRVFLTVLFVVAMSGLVHAQGTTGKKSDYNEETKKQILALEQEKVQALERSGSFGADWFERHYADDIDYVSGNGASFTKAQTVDEFRSGARKLHLVHHDDFHVNVYGNTAVLSYRGNDVMERNGKVGNRELVRTTDVYVKQDDGVWRIVVHHVTPIQAQ